MLFATKTMSPATAKPIGRLPTAKVPSKAPVCAFNFVTSFEEAPNHPRAARVRDGVRPLVNQGLRR